MSYTAYVTIVNVARNEERGDVIFHMVSTDACQTYLVRSFHCPGKQEVGLYSDKYYMREGIIWKVRMNSDGRGLSSPPEKAGLSCTIF